MAGIDYAMTLRPLLLTPDECGDTAFIREFDGMCLLALVDILGHGKEARDVGLLADAFLADNYSLDVVQLLNGLHDALRGTRGAVAAACRLDVRTGELRYAGVGNITVRVFGPSNHRFVPRDGVIGYIMSSPREEMIQLHQDDVLVMHSDGVKGHTDLSEYPRILREPAVTIAQTFVDRFARGDDDASCVVLRYLI